MGTGLVSDRVIYEEAVLGKNNRKRALTTTPQLSCNKTYVIWQRVVWINKHQSSKSSIG